MQVYRLVSLTDQCSLTWFCSGTGPRYPKINPYQKIEQTTPILYLRVYTISVESNECRDGVF